VKGRLPLYIRAVKERISESSHRPRKSSIFHDLNTRFSTFPWPIKYKYCFRGLVYFAEILDGRWSMATRPQTRPHVSISFLSMRPYPPAHLCRKIVWDGARARGGLRPSSVAKKDFCGCSLPAHSPPPAADFEGEPFLRPSEPRPACQGNSKGKPPRINTEGFQTGFPLTGPRTPRPRRGNPEDQGK
jgi:hypothetical protein